MSDAVLAEEIATVLIEAQREWRTSHRLGCLVTPPVPDGLIRHWVDRLLPRVLEALRKEDPRPAILKALLGPDVVTRRVGHPVTDLRSRP
mgnify:FL=1